MVSGQMEGKPTVELTVLLITNRSSYLEDGRQIQDVTKDRKVGMDQEGCHNSNRISIRREWNWNRVEKNGNQDTSSGACHDHVDELKGECGLVTSGLEHFASYIKQQKEPTAKQISERCS